MNSSMIIITITLIVFFFIMIFLPAIPMLRTMYKKEDRQPLFMDMDYVFNPKFQVENFEKSLQRNAFNHIEVDHILKTTDISYSHSKTPIIVNSDKELKVETGVFSGVIVNAEMGIRTEKKVNLYGLKSDHSISLEDENRIDGWIDTKEVVELKGATSVNVVTAKTVKLHQGVSFKRIYADTIGVFPLNEEDENKIGEDISYEKYYENVETDIIYIDENESIKEGSVIHSDVICRGNLKIEKGCKIFGSVKTNGSLEIDDNTQVYGNLFSDQTLQVNNHCFIFGNLFSHTYITIGHNCQIGKYHSPKSVIGIKGIQIAGGTFIHNYILTYGEGKIV